MDKRRRENNQAYMTGSSAVQLEGNYSNYRSQRTKEKTKPLKRIKANHIKSNPMYTIILSFVIVATLGLSVILLKTQFSVSDNAQKIINLKQELVQIKKKNDQISGDIQKGINMDEVYKTATEELGMVQAKKEDIEYIPSKDITYTVQLAELDVKKDKEGTNIGNILAFISKGW